MSWTSAIKKATKAQQVYQELSVFARPPIPQHAVDWPRLVSLDFETFFDNDYTLSKMSTSEYIRDPRFKAQMVGIKIGLGKTKFYPAARVEAALRRINWTTHSLLAHNAQFDAFILSHHYDIHPAFIYDSLAMARGLHSNEIGAGLDEVSIYYGGQGKKEGLEATKGVLNWDKAMVAYTGIYCVNDVDEMFRVFCLMLPKLPADEIELINVITKMFTSPVLRVDIPRVEKELARELAERDALFFSTVKPDDYEPGGKLYDEALFKTLLKGPAERALEGVPRGVQIIKRILGSSERFAELLRAEGVEPPVKISPAWMKKGKDEREECSDSKYSYAFAKDDAKFIELPDRVEDWGFDLEDPEQVKLMSIKQARLQNLVNCRIAVKSTTNITRAQRFLTAGANGMPLPCGYAYSRAHTHRLGGQNKMNMQNLKRGGELRLSILAPKGYQLVVVDSGQIEARVNGWLWGQNDLLDAFLAADGGTGRDAYCNFADHIYGRVITKEDKTERFVGKVCIAEGELVLTDRGLVPINLISKEDRLWDGVEWVTHDGVIDQGIKEVITYDGLTATPDHEVFTEDGRIIPLGQAASEMARLQRTGAEGQSIRFCDDHVVADTPRKRLSVRVGAMQPERSQKTDLPEQPEKRQDNIVLEERASSSSPCGSLGSTIRRDSRQVQQPSAQALGELRRAGDQMLVQDQDELHPVGLYESAARGLQGGGDRQGGQRRALCAREFEVGYTAGKHTKPTQHSEDHVAWATDSAVGVSESVQPSADFPVHEGRVYWGADSGDGPAASGAQMPQLAGHSRQVRCYDIANAGPRRRYTVSGCLVLNCVLGLGFMMGAAKLQITLAKGALGGPPVYFTLDQCKAIINTYRLKNHRIKDGWEICKGIIEDMAAGRTGSHGPLNWEKGTIWLPNGMALHYPDLRKSRNEESGWDEWSYASGDMRKKIYGGLLCENIVQALARIIVLWQTLMISRTDRIVMTTHDEAVACVKTRRAPGCFKDMTKWMRTPPAWCPDIPLNCEGGWDFNYSK